VLLSLYKNGQTIIFWTQFTIIIQDNNLSMIPFMLDAVPRAGPPTFSGSPHQPQSASATSTSLGSTAHVRLHCWKATETRHQSTINFLPST
jgi:hypothetical protein